MDANPTSPNGIPISIRPITTEELDRVVFTGPGEPLTHPRIAYLVRVAAFWRSKPISRGSFSLLAGK